MALYWCNLTKTLLDLFSTYTRIVASKTFKRYFPSFYCGTTAKSSSLRESLIGRDKGRLLMPFAHSPSTRTVCLVHNFHDKKKRKKREQRGESFPDRWKERTSPWCDGGKLDGSKRCPFLAHAVSGTDFHQYCWAFLGASLLPSVTKQALAEL